MSKHTFPAYRIQDGECAAQNEVIANEEPLHITLNGEAYVTTMRSADGNDVALTRGLLFSEGIIVDQAASLSFTQIVDHETSNIARLDVTVDPDSIAIPVAGRRTQMATSSCGICGTRDPASLMLDGTPLKVTKPLAIASDLILTMVESMAKAQKTFQATGGTHGAGAYTANATELVVREDIGRHNAVDKVLGTLLENDQLHNADVLTVSGRVSYEIVSKAYRSQIPILVAVSAPSSMAVQTAQAFGITLIGFCRENRFTVYTHTQRILETKELA